MKKLKIFFLLFVSLFLFSCWNNDKKSQLEILEINKEKTQYKLDEKKPLINVQENLKETEYILKKMWLTGEKLKKTLQEEKIHYDMIANLKWDDRKKYVLEKIVLSSIVNDKKITPDFCKTNNILEYTKCMNIKNISLEKVLEKIPIELQDIVKQNYYYNKFTLNPKDIIKIKVSDPIAILVKKQMIKERYYNWLITKISTCDKLLEQETKYYCRSLFKK